MRTELVALLLVLLVVASAGSGFLVGRTGASNNVVSTVTSTSTLSQPVQTTTQTATVTSTSTLSQPVLTTTRTTTVTSTETFTLNTTSGQLGTWNPTTSFPGANPPSECVTSSGYIYCVGGNDNATYYAPIASNGVGTWARGTDYPIPIQGEDCVATSGYVYCVGGESTAPAAKSADPYGRVANVYYAPISGTGMGPWKSSSPFPHIAPFPRCMTVSSYLYCVMAYFDGTGFSSNGADLFSAPLSSSGVGSWTKSPGPGNMTAGCSAIGGYAYCYGGGACPRVGPRSDCYSPSFAAPLSSTGQGSWTSTTPLPTAVFEVYVSAESFVYYLGAPTFFAHASAGVIGPWQSTTNYPESSYPGACASSGAQIYCVGSSKGGVYFTTMGAPDPYALTFQNPPPFPRVQYLRPAWSDSAGGCSVNGVGAPCFSNNIDDATIFNCAASAATSSGCMTTVVSPTKTSYNYDLTIWYPDSNAPTPNANCRFLPAVGYSQPVNAWCASINATSFIIAQQVPLLNA